MKSVNHDIACNVKGCKFNSKGCNCTLDKITVGCACGDTCTCCESYSEK
ncbi:MAG: DUF1540 domain-containing protein [Clostridia bacterium]|nr:DUF1540 domain-containing protein [Clostridia bacterium]